jgi:hypothetical protein
MRPSLQTRAKSPQKPIKKAVFRHFFTNLREECPDSHDFYTAVIRSYTPRSRSYAAFLRSYAVFMPHLLDKIFALHFIFGMLRKLQSRASQKPRVR